MSLHVHSDQFATRSQKFIAYIVVPFSAIDPMPRSTTRRFANSSTPANGHRQGTITSLLRFGWQPLGQRDLELGEPFEAFGERVMPIRDGAGIPEHLSAESSTSPSLALTIGAATRSRIVNRSGRDHLEFGDLRSAAFPMQSALSRRVACLR